MEWYQERKGSKEDCHTPALPHAMLSNAVLARANMAPARLSAQGCKRGKTYELAQQLPWGSETSRQDTAVRALLYLAAPSSCLGSMGKIRVQRLPVEGATSHGKEPHFLAGSSSETELVRFFYTVKTRSKQINIVRSK